MKYLLILLVVLAVVWMLRGGLRRRMPPPPDGGARPQDPRPMLTCAHCGIHLPRDEALPGRGGVFCDAAHRAAFERAHPDT
ncbi:MAG: PP0621 family protein [Burkholderiaceae bacterium]